MELGKFLEITKEFKILQECRELQIMLVWSLCDCLHCKYLGRQEMRVKKHEHNKDLTRHIDICVHKCIYSMNPCTHFTQIHAGPQNYKAALSAALHTYTYLLANRPAKYTHLYQGRNVCNATATLPTVLR